MVKLVAKKVTQAEVRPTAGEMVIRFHDEEAGESEFTIGFTDLIALAAEAQTAAVALQSHGGTPTSGMGWKEISLIDPQKMEVYPLEMQTEPSVGLFFDRGTPREVSYRLFPETIADLQLMLSNALKAYSHRGREQ